MKIPAISVFFPAYNEEKNIEKTVGRAIKILEKIARQYEVIVVDDGSIDQTSVIVRKMVKKNSKIRLITHAPNRGYGAALKSGFYHARYDWIAYTDSDNQFDFKEINNFLVNKNKADLIIGYRAPRRDSWQRILIARLLRLWNFIFFGLWVKDVDCGFKLIKKEVINKINRLQVEGGMIETELLIKAKKAGFKIIEIPVSHYQRQKGRQTGADLKVVFKAVKESFQLWSVLKNS